jgi:tRNA pseudouridine38-40 synthase
MRYLKLTVGYDGTAYVGWQVQPNGDSIQANLESAWLGITGETIRITASGRTDAGVHALGQVCSLATESELPEATLVRGLNAKLPDDIVIYKVEPAPADFHAIRDAVSKCYRYQIQHGSIPDPFQRHYVWHMWPKLNVDAMQRAAATLVGKHDFASFQAQGAATKTTVRTIGQLEIKPIEQGIFQFLHIEIEADGFLYNMVRNIVGTLIDIGADRKPVGWMQEVLDQRDRNQAGQTAPPHALFLVNVNYDDQQKLLT